jgi:class 3 adenylate cyclase
MQPRRPALAAAEDGQILVMSRVAEAVEAIATFEDLGNLEPKGLSRPVAAFQRDRSSLAGDSPAQARRALRLRQVENKGVRTRAGTQ